jgi:hypothetical protein
MFLNFHDNDKKHRILFNAFHSLQSNKHVRCKFTLLGKASQANHKNMKDCARLCKIVKNSENCEKLGKTMKDCECGNFCFICNFMNKGSRSRDEHAMNLAVILQIRMPSF